MELASLRFLIEYHLYTYIVLGVGLFAPGILAPAWFRF
jgi:hypothetical protein